MNARASLLLVPLLLLASPAWGDTLEDDPDNRISDASGVHYPCKRADLREAVYRNASDGGGTIWLSLADLRETCIWQTEEIRYDASWEGESTFREGTAREEYRLYANFEGEELEYVRYYRSICRDYDNGGWACGSGSGTVEGIFDMDNSTIEIPVTPDPPLDDVRFDTRGPRCAGQVLTHCSAHSDYMPNVGHAHFHDE